jgi:hypothetical protein
MDYEDMLDQSDHEANGRMLATKILDLMDKLRLGNNPEAAKRWIWELLQNAKDIAFQDIGVSVKIELESRGSENYLVFRHNGQPFSAKTITFLIRQVSIKDRHQKEGEQKSTGKFGTGFLSTHLLSEKVLVHGIVKDDNLPYRKFNLLLDRSPIELDEVIKSVQSSLKDIRRSLAPQEPPVAFDRSAYNTSFEYQLEPNKIKIAEAGITDLHSSLPYTLAFSPQIRFVSVLHEGIVYELDGAPQILANGFELVTIKENYNGNTHAETKIIVVRGSKAAVAVEVLIDENEGSVQIVQIKNDQPRLFCDFPLIGSHDFPFPVVVNSPNFNPNEPRSAIWLTEKEDYRIIENREIMKEAVSLYEKLLNCASENLWHELFNLVDIKPAISSEWLSINWYAENILSPLRHVILHTDLVVNPHSGMIAMLNKDNIPQVRFPVALTNDAREKIWQLAAAWIPEKLPPLKEVHDWQRVIWYDCDQLTIETLAKFIEEAENVNTIAQSINMSEADAIGWLNDFFRLCDLDPAFRKRVNDDEFQVIPSQNGIFKKRSHLLVPQKVDELLKDALKILGEDIREKLVHPHASTGNEIKYTVYNQQQLIDHINTALQNNKTDDQPKYDACDFIVTLFSTDDSFPKSRREAIYQFSKLLYPTTVAHKKNLQFYQSDIFKEADKIQMRAIVHNIAEKKTIAKLTESLSLLNTQATLNWLNTFVSFLVDNDFESQLELKNHPILPNQNGALTSKDNLNLDDGEIPDELKDISAAMGSDFRDKLLDIAIFLKLPANRVTSAAHVADEIVRLITPRLTEYPRTDQTKAIFRQVYLYFARFPENAKLLFKELYGNKHMLFDHEEIASSMEKIEKVNQLLKDYNIDDINDLRNILDQRKQAHAANAESEQEIITKETLAALGITSEEQLKKLIGEDPTSSRFKHVSISDPEYYRYANSIIDRTRKNVIDHLKTLPEYQFNEQALDTIARTVIGGIRKNGIPVHIVFRPSDNGQVLFYFPSEKATLDLANAELWIDDGINTPRHLTLGRILTVTGINRIPI